VKACIGRLALVALILPAASFGCGGSEGQTLSPPDLSGFWTPGRGEITVPQALLDRLAPDAVLIEDVGAVELPAGDFGGLIVRPDARAAALQWSPEDDMRLDRACTPPSIVYAMQGPFPMEIHQGTELKVIQLEYFDMFRLVFTDGRTVPPDAPHSKTGYSIGRWQDDMLIVETSRLSAATITNNGLDHSDQVYVVERFVLGDDGRLYATQEFEDPQVLENRGARIMAWTRVPGQHVFPYECDPTFALEFMDR
jgi:hypothetical protein